MLQHPLRGFLYFCPATFILPKDEPLWEVMHLLKEGQKENCKLGEPDLGDVLFVGVVNRLQ